MSKLRGPVLLLATLFVLLIAGYWSGSMNKNREGRVPANPGDHSGVVLYFCDREGNLKAEYRALEAADDPPTNALLELIRGSSDGSGLLPTIPEGTRLVCVVVTDGVANADFSAELQANHWGGSLAEMITVYSVVNTLSQFPDIERTRILVDSKEIDSLAGYLDLREPLAANFDLVRR